MSKVLAEIISEIKLTNLSKENETENNGKLVLTSDGIVKLDLEKNAFYSLITKRLENLKTIDKRAKNPGGTWFRKILVNLLAKAVKKDEVISQVEGLKKEHSADSVKVVLETIRKKEYLTLIWGEGRAEKFHFKENQFENNKVKRFQNVLKAFTEGN